MAIKVCLDAGHYGKYNRSPAVSSYYESDMTWKLHNYLKKELEAFGIGVVTTRTNQNTDRALYERGAASKGCNLFISVHSNAVGNGVNENVDYPVAYVREFDTLKCKKVPQSLEIGLFFCQIFIFII